VKNFDYNQHALFCVIKQGPLWSWKRPPSFIGGGGEGPKEMAMSEVNGGKPERKGDIFPLTIQETWT